MNVLSNIYNIVGVNVGSKLPAYTEVGGYTIAYYTGCGECVCNKCATTWENEHDKITFADVYWEGPTLSCIECNCDIESSYGEVG